MGFNMIQHLTKIAQHMEMTAVVYTSRYGKEHMRRRNGLSFVQLMIYRLICTIPVHVSKLKQCQLDHSEQNPLQI